MRDRGVGVQHQLPIASHEIASTLPFGGKGDIVCLIVTTSMAERCEAEETRDAPFHLRSAWSDASGFGFGFRFRVFRSRFTVRESCL